MTLLLVGALVVAGVLAIHAVFIAPFDLRVTSLDVPIDGLDRTFDGYAVAVVGDLHYQPMMPAWYLSRVVAFVTEARPDLVAHLGDYSVSLRHNRPFSVAMYQRMLPHLSPIMKRLRGRDGAVAVLGNHDHYFDATRVESWLEELGVRVLRNRAMTIERAGANLTIAGIGDAFEDRIDLTALVQPTVRHPTVLLSHNPDGVRHLGSAFRPDLMLSGHTHGGQVVLPGLGALVRFSRVCGRHTASGWIPNPLVRLYVTRGVGCQFLLRFRCPPELVIVRLRSSAGSTPLNALGEEETDR